MSGRKKKYCGTVHQKQRNTTRKWRENDVLAILEYFKHVVQKNQQIEKPTAAVFYEEMIKILKLEVSVVQAKNKVRHLRTSYYKAVEWLNQTGTDVDERSLRDYILDICPFWDFLSEIFGGEPQTIPSFEHFEPTLPSPPTLRTYKRSHSTTSSPAFSEEKMGHTSATDRLTPSYEKFEENCSQTSKPNEASTSSSAQMRRASAIEESNRIELMWKEGQLKLSTERFEFEKRTTEQVFLVRREHQNWERKMKEKVLELRVKEIETNERLRILEIEKDERIERYRIEQECKVKLELSKHS